MSPSAGRVACLGRVTGDEAAGARGQRPAAEYLCAAAKKKGDGGASRGWEGEQGKERMQTPSQPSPHSMIPSDAQSGSGACVRVFARTRELGRPEQGGKGVGRLCGTCMGVDEDAKGGRVYLCPDRWKGTCHCHSSPPQDQLTILA